MNLTGKRLTVVDAGACCPDSSSKTKDIRSLASRCGVWWLTADFNPGLFSAEGRHHSLPSGSSHPMTGQCRVTKARPFWLKLRHLRRLSQIQRSSGHVLQSNQNSHLPLLTSLPCRCGTGEQFLIDTCLCFRSASEEHDLQNHGTPRVKIFGRMNWIV